MCRTLARLQARNLEEAHVIVLVATLVIGAAAAVGVILRFLRVRPRRKPPQQPHWSERSADDDQREAPEPYAQYPSEYARDPYPPAYASDPSSLDC